MASGEAFYEDDEPAARPRARARPQSAMSAQSYDDNTSMSGPILKNDEDEDVSACVKYKHCLRSLWATRQTEQENLANRDVYIKTTLRELITYIFFLVVLSIVAFGMVNINMFYLTDSMTNLFVRRYTADGYTTYDKLVTIDDYWTWLSSVMVGGLYWSQWYNGNATSTVYYENVVLGLPRIRQLRNMPNQGCSVPEIFANSISFCYSPWTGGRIADTSFVAPSDLSTTYYTLYNNVGITAWTYNPNSNGVSYTGLASVYDNDGYSQLLPNGTQAADVIDMLRTEGWIDRGTRAVFIEFTVYNADVNLFCIAQITVELPPTGGVLPSYQFRTVKLLRYVSGFDYFILACEILYLIFIVYYIIEEIIEIKKLKCEYFKSFWSWLDIIIILVSIILAAFDIYRTVTVDNTLSRLVKNPNQYSDFTFLGYWQTQYQNAIAITVFFAYLKIFKYVSFNKTMTQLQVTLARCAGELFGFAIIFFIFFLAYAMLGYLLFGSNLSAYKTFGDSVFALFRTILGDFDFDGMYRVNSFLGPLYFVSYVFFIFFILLQMFLAIINDSYALVKAELMNTKNEFELGQYLKTRCSRMIEKLSFKKKEIIDIQQAMRFADVNDEGIIDCQKMREELKMRGYADAEIEAVFASHDIDGDRVLNDAEVVKMHTRLEEDKSNLNKELNALNLQMAAVQNSTKGTSFEEYNILMKRVERTESSINGIVVKIDTVLERMETLEKTKSGYREKLGQLLESLKDFDDGMADHAMAQGEGEGEGEAEAEADDPDKPKRETDAQVRDRLEDFVDEESAKIMEKAAAQRPDSAESNSGGVLFYNDKEKISRPTTARVLK